MPNFLQREMVELEAKASDDGPKRADAFFGLLSQAANSGGNMLLTLVVARASSQEQYGAWALGYAAFMMALTVSRAIAATPLMLTRYPDHEGLQAGARGALTLSMLVGGTGGLILTAASLIDARIWEAAASFALVMPLVLGQDVLRYFLFARGVPRDVAVIDLSWLAIQSSLFIVLAISEFGGATMLTLAWAIAAVPGGLWVLARRRVAPSLKSVLPFWSSTRTDGLKLVADAVIASATTQALPVVVAIAAGLAAAGSLRGGLTLLGGINILVAGLTPVAILLVRREYDRTGRFRRFLSGWTASILLISGVNGAIIWALPDAWGREVLGDTWLSAGVIMTPLILQSMIRGPFSGVPIGFRATDRVGMALKLRMWTSVPAIIFPWGGAIAFGVQGAAWGIFVSAVVSNVICLGALRNGRKLNRP